MTTLSLAWLFLFGIREGLAVFTSKTTLLTAAITGMQLLNLFLLMQKKNWHFTHYHLLLLIFIALVPYNPGTLVMVNLTLTLLLLKDIPFESVAFVSSLSMLIGLFIYLSGYSLGFAKDVVGLSHKGGYFHTFGFKNPNTQGLAFLRVILVVSTFIIVNFRFKLPVYLFLLPEYFVFLMTKSRTSFYAACIYFFFLLYFSFNRGYRIERKLSIVLPIILYALTFLLCAFYAMFPIIDIFFSRRFSFNNVTLGNLSLIQYVIGSRMPEDSPLDSAFIVQMFNGGIFSVYVFLSVCLRGLHGMKVKAAKVFLPYVLCILISGFSEDTFSMSYVSVILLYKMLSDQFEIKNIRSRYVLRPADFYGEKIYE